MMDIRPNTKHYYISRQQRKQRKYKYLLSKKSKRNAFDHHYTVIDKRKNIKSKKRLIQQYCNLDEEEIGDYGFKHIKPKLTHNWKHRHYDDLFMEHVTKTYKLFKCSLQNKRYRRYKIPYHRVNEEIIGLYQHKTSVDSKFRYLIKSTSRGHTNTYWMDTDDQNIQPYLLHADILWLDSLKIYDKLWFLDDRSGLNEWCIGILKEYILRIDKSIITLKVTRVNDPLTHLKDIVIDLKQMTESDVSQKAKQYIAGNLYDNMVCKSCGKMADGTNYGMIPKCIKCHEYYCNACISQFEYCKLCVIKEEIEEMADIIGEGIAERNVIDYELAADSNVKSKIEHIIAEYSIGYIIDCPNKKNCNNTIYIDNEYEFDKIFSYYDVYDAYINQWKNGEIVWVYGKYRRFFCNDRQNCQMIQCKRRTLYRYSNCRLKDAVLSVCLNHIPNCDICNKPGSSKCLYCESYLCDNCISGAYCRKCHDIRERKSISEPIAMTIDSPMDVIQIITEYLLGVITKCSNCNNIIIVNTQFEFNYLNIDCYGNKISKYKIHDFLRSFKCNQYSIINGIPYRVFCHQCIQNKCVVRTTCCEHSYPDTVPICPNHQCVRCTECGASTSRTYHGNTIFIECNQCSKFCCSKSSCHYDGLCKSCIVENEYLQLKNCLTELLGSEYDKNTIDLLSLFSTGIGAKCSNDSCKKEIMTDTKFEYMSLKNKVTDFKNMNERYTKNAQCIFGEDTVLFCDDISNCRFPWKRYKQQGTTLKLTNQQQWNRNKQWSISYIPTNYTRRALTINFLKYGDLAETVFLYESNYRESYGIVQFVNVGDATQCVLNYRDDPYLSKGIDIVFADETDPGIKKLLCTELLGTDNRLTRPRHYRTCVLSGDNRSKWEETVIESKNYGDCDDEDGIEYECHNLNEYNISKRRNLGKRMRIRVGGRSKYDKRRLDKISNIKSMKKLINSYCLKPYY